MKFLILEPLDIQKFVSIYVYDRERYFCMSGKISEDDVFIPHIVEAKDGKPGIFRRDLVNRKWVYQSKIGGSLNKADSQKLRNQLFSPCFIDCSLSQTGEYWFKAYKLLVDDEEPKLRVEAMLLFEFIKENGKFHGKKERFFKEHRERRLTNAQGEVQK